MTVISTNSPSTPCGEITLRVAKALGDIDRAAWDACANPPGAPAADGTLGRDVRVEAQDRVAAQEAAGSASDNEYNPFISHVFLTALGRSRSTLFPYASPFSSSPPPPS